MTAGDGQSLKKLLNIYTSDQGLLQGEIHMRAVEIARAGELGPLIMNDDAFDVATAAFSRNCRNYWRNLGVDDPSHLKIFGHLLYSLTHSRMPDGSRAVFFGVRPENLGNLKDRLFTIQYFHEYASFVIVYEMLCHAQRQRLETLRFDPLKPPMSRRFTRSMIDYLREWPEGSLATGRTPFDLYMVFKAMDLYGVEPGATP